MNWRPFFWWLAFTIGWIALFAEFLIRAAWLVIAASGLLGFLTLCGFDIWLARRTRRALQDEYLRKHYPQAKPPGPVPPAPPRFVTGESEAEVGDQRSEVGK
ncbi:MAG: hypothetical protein V7609_2129 [Verrucomicrobiota bacterium]